MLKCCKKCKIVLNILRKGLCDKCYRKKRNRKKINWPHKCSICSIKIKRKVNIYSKCKNCYKQNWYKKRKITFKLKYAAARMIAKRRNRHWNLSYKIYIKLIKANCFYCQANLMLEHGGCLDRIDNSKGYIKNNVLPCCKTCNKIRMDSLSVEEMKVGMKAILRYRNAKKFVNR